MGRESMALTLAPNAIRFVVERVFRIKEEVLKKL
jgi:hypothetical protein